MARYKLLNQWLGGSNYIVGEIYDDEVEPKLKTWINSYPHDWELIKENNMEKTLTITVEKAREIYGKSPEMDELLLANFSKEKLEKAKLPAKWTDLEKITGYFLDINDVVKSGQFRPNPHVIGIFATEKQAKSALAMAQLSQLMKVYNGDWEPNRSDDSQPKFVIFRKNDNIEVDTFYNSFQFLTFKDSNLRDEFRKNFEPLIKQYFMLD